MCLQTEMGALASTVSARSLGAPAKRDVTVIAAEAKAQTDKWFHVCIWNSVGGWPVCSRTLYNLQQALSIQRDYGAIYRRKANVFETGTFVRPKIASEYGVWSWNVNFEDDFLDSLMTEGRAMQAQHTRIIAQLDAAAAAAATREATAGPNAPTVKPTSVEGGGAKAALAAVPSDAQLTHFASELSKLETLSNELHDEDKKNGMHHDDPTEQS